MNAWLNKEQGKPATRVTKRALAVVRSLLGIVSSADSISLRASTKSATLALLAVALASNAAASTEPTNTRAKLDYSTFKLIAQRNIFNAHRSIKPPTARGESRPPPRIDTFTLVGTLRYEKGVFAFFEGSSPEYRKVVKVAGSIAGCQVTDIEPASVKLAAGTGDIQLSVGRQLRREEGGVWRLAEVNESATITPAAAVSRPTSPPDTARATTAGPAAATAVSNPDSQPDLTDPVLVRLMEKRKQETSK